MLLLIPVGGIWKFIDQEMSLSPPSLRVNTSLLKWKGFVEKVGFEPGVKE